MTWLARLSITHRAIVGLVTVLLLVFGAVSAVSLRQELLPSLDLPVVTVVTPYPGASPEVVEQQVTNPVEAAVAGVDGLAGTSSTSTSGSSVVTIDLEYGTDTAEATSQVERAIAGAGLPADVTPDVGTIGTDAIPVVQLAVSSGLPAEEAAAVLRDRVQPLLAGIEGVGGVTLSGIRERRVTIDLDAAEAARRGVSPQAVSALLQANGVRVPAGELTPDTEPTTVQVGSPITAAEQLADLYVPPRPPPAARG
jgi:hydrophobic/amphiphilic exporter-1 (mainly G- bacteria), HAE1 family